jgi:hypothetical protein
MVAPNGLLRLGKCNIALGVAIGGWIILGFAG